MGPEGTGLCLHATKATTPSKDFTFKYPFTDYHVFYNIALILYIFLLGGLKINHVKEI